LGSIVFISDFSIQGNNHITNGIYATEVRIAKSIAFDAGRVIRHFFEEALTSERKADGSPVTAVDTAINQYVINELQKHFVDQIVGEELCALDQSGSRQWFCDPIDGTRVFTWGAPTALFSLGLVVDGRPVLGVVYDPFLNRLFEAVVGMGAYCNGKRLAVSTQQLQGADVAISNNIDRLIAHPDSIIKLHEYGAWPASFSGAIYRACLVAQGRLVGCFDPALKAHDMAAIQVIVEEAGGRVTDCNGRQIDYRMPFRGAVASNGIVHDKLVVCARLC
jgi:fructose-1,6-bisphosphatase/inositol monophosphatase family enzyme